MRSPTARTLQRLRSLGYTAAVVERWNSFAQRVEGSDIRGKHQDLFGAFDAVAIRSDKPGVLGVQATSRSNAAARVKKLVALPVLRVWLSAGNRCEVWSWAKSKRLGRWQLVRRVIGLEDVRCVNS